MGIPKRPPARREKEKKKKKKSKNIKILYIVQDCSVKLSVCIIYLIIVLQITLHFHLVPFSRWSSKQQFPGPLISSHFQIMATAETPPSCCSNPGCDQPGTSKCSACNATPYCGPICQTAHWTCHKESCDGHLLKVGNAHLTKALGFDVTNHSVQVLRYSDLALAKLNAMKKRPLEAISQALACKCTALQEMGRDVESLLCAKDKYNLWAMVRGPAHPSTIDAAFYLIDALLHNNEYEDANLFAHTLWEIIHTNNHVDNDIPGEERQEYVAMAAILLAQAIYRLTESGGIPPEEKQKAGEEAIARAREALEIRIQLHGTESECVSIVMGALADVLGYFNDGGDDEVLRLYQQAIAIGNRVCGSTSGIVGAHESNLGVTYCRRAAKAHAADDLDQYVANLQLALPHFHEAARIYRVINHIGDADSALRKVAQVEENMRQAGIMRAAAVIG